MSDKDPVTIILTIVLSFAMIVAGASNIYMLLQFRDLQLDQESEQSTSKNALIGILWAQAILPLVIAILPIPLAIMKKEKTNVHYAFPLSVLLIMTVLLTVGHTALYFLLRNLTVLNKDSEAYKRFSAFVFIAPISYLLFMIITLFIWWWSRKSVEITGLQKEKKVREQQKEQIEKQKEKELQSKYEEFLAQQKKAEKLAAIKQQQQELAKARKELEEAGPQQQQELAKARKELEKQKQSLFEPEPKW